METAAPIMVQELMAVIVVTDILRFGRGYIKISGYRRIFSGNEEREDKRPSIPSKEFP